MKPKSRMVQVCQIEDLSPHVRRIVLTGQSLSDFPQGKESAHIKAVFPEPKSSKKFFKVSILKSKRKWIRSYTIRYFDPTKMTLTIDFVVNSHEGLASNWARQAKIGDHLGIAGPGDTKHTDRHAKRHLFYGDLASLPAIASTLEHLPKNAEGKAWIQIPCKEDKQRLAAPSGITINWMINDINQENQLLDALSTEPRDLYNSAIFIATEASLVKKLKSYLEKNHHFNKEKLYVSAYWKKT